MDKDKDLLEGEKIKVGITLGDINGIGPEVVIKALSDNRILQSCTPIIYGSSKTLNFHNKSISSEPFHFLSIKDADEAKEKKVNVVQTWNDEPTIQFGQANVIGGKHAFLSLEKATQDLAVNKIDVLVTAPISKETIIQAGFEFIGHTEYLADMSGVEEALMIMVAEEMRVALVTTHVALKTVSEQLTREKVLNKIVQLNQCLQADFGKRKPRIAVLGMNPHAGENGKMGTEEQEIILPAINQAREKGILAFGPFPADGLFGSESRSQYDAVLAMYHDQGLTPFKALAFDSGVNYTAGLPIVRTSPDHGTAFDIAGKGIASESSFRHALYQAMDIYKARKFNKEVAANPLVAQQKNKR